MSLFDKDVGFMSHNGIESNHFMHAMT